MSNKRNPQNDLEEEKNEVHTIPSSSKKAKVSGGRSKVCDACICSKPRNEELILCCLCMIMKVHRSCVDDITPKYTERHSIMCSLQCRCYAEVNGITGTMVEESTTKLNEMSKLALKKLARAESVPITDKSRDLSKAAIFRKLVKRSLLPF